ncbi:MAG TPA: esterase-like activity of phytase family protein [Polyangiales bacterium]
MKKPSAIRSLHLCKLVLAGLLLALGCESTGSSPSSPHEPVARPPADTTAALSNTVTLLASRDTAVRASAPNTNGGSGSVLDLNRTLIDFDAAAIRSAVGPRDYVTSAQLELHLVTNLLRRTPRSAQVYKLTQAWSESGATWNCANDTDPSNTVADCAGSAQWSMGAGPNPWALPASANTAIPATISGSMRAELAGDVRSIVAGQSSFGWMIEGGTAGERGEFASRESATSPQLVLAIRHCDPAQCDDGDPCTHDSCDATALCTHSAAIDGTTCNDGNACTQLDACLAGVCTGGGPVACAALDQCHAAGACDPSTGVCSNPAVADGSPCSDGNGCTSADTCNAGVCSSGGPVVCAATDGCHPGICDPASGACSNPQQCALYGVGALASTLNDGLVVSPRTLEDGTSNNNIGAFGSAITYTGVGNLYIATPDRGPNNGLDSYTNRYYQLEISLAGGVVTPRVVGGATLKRDASHPFNGLASSFDATNSPSSLRLDPEGVRVSPQGTFFVSDEYGPFVYEFNSNGDRLRALAVPSKFLIDQPDALNELPPTNTKGRQSNRGMEGLAISPDGHKLYGIMQNALLQDGALNGSNARVGLNNRLLEVDVNTGATREFLYQLDSKSYGVNELLAINDHQFLVIERDGNGGTSAAFKRLFRIDISHASDISGVASLPTTGTPSGVTPVAKSAFLDLLAPEYGLAGAGFPEKIEGLAFGPDLPDGRHVLIVTNDNDFLTANTNNFYVFAIGTPALPGYAAPQPTFSSACTNVSCAAADPCHAAGMCDPATGACSNPAVADGTACDDGNASTISDACVAGVCAGTDLCANVVCSATDTCHVAGSCDHQTGACSNPTAADGILCSDGNPTTVGDACVGGVCLGVDLCLNVTCARSDQCHVAGTCDYHTGACGNPTAADGTACNDGNAATVGDACVAGICTGNDLCAAVTCAASDQCHVAGSCDAQTGTCSNPAASDGTACNDGNAGTINDVCTSGACQGTDRCAGVVCSALDQCHVAGTCDSLTGTCGNPTKTDGSACNDGNACTHGDVCTAGACAGAATVCPAGVDRCHAGVCNAQTGACSNAVNQCSLYGMGAISGTATDGLIVSPRILEDGTPNNEIGAFGSAISYTGIGNLYVATPDRGPNNGLDSYNDRYYEIEISLAGGVVTPRVVGGDTFKREDGAQFTGLGSAFDATGSAAGSLRLDPEGVRVTPSGTMFVSDEYGPYVYEFGNDGKRLRSISVPSKFLIAHPTDANGNELPPVNTSGRVTNRGMEGLALSPDGTKLYGLMQSPLLQDGALDSGNNKAGTNNRMLEITLSTGATREFLYQMVDKKYGLNELLAINDHQFMVIERDANGEAAAVFKKLFLIDISNATDVSNVASLPTTGTPSGVTPVSKTVFLDLLASDYGLAGASFPEKIEGITFGPDLPDGRHTLVVTNDNDFITDSTGHPNNFYVFAIGTPALPGFVAPTHAFSSVCDTVTCVAAGGCYLPGTCDPSNGSCPNPTTASGTPSGTQTAGDCQKSQCDGSGNQVTVADNTDLPNDGNQCTGDSCVSGAPTYTNLASGTMCSQSGGNVCDGAGGCVSCLLAADCPGSDADCSFRTCNAGTCSVGYATAGTPTSSQIAGDCDVVQCNGSGGTVSVIDDSDVPNDGNPCTSDVCTNGVPSHSNTAGGTSCGSGQFCDGAGRCSGCLTGTDCPGVDTDCQHRTCTSGACGVSYTAAGTATSSQTAGDCLENQCDGAGNIVVNNKDTDVPNDNNQCTNDLCGLSTPVYANTTYGTLCSQSSGQICNGSGSCIAPTFRVVRVGTGATLTSAATAVFVEEYTQAGSLVGTLTMPTAVSGSNRILTMSGTASSEGGISLSGDGHYLALAGYDAPTGTAAVASTAVATVNRITGRIDASGTINSTTRFTTGFDLNNIRGAATNDGTGFWAGGAGSATKGVWYLALGASGGTQLNSAIATNWPAVVAGQLYCSSAKNPNIFTVGTGLATTGTPAETTLPGYPTAALTNGPFGYAFLDLNSSVAGNDTLFVADDTGGIKKWTYNGTTWSQATSTFTKNGATAANFRGVVAIASSTSSQTSGVTLIAGTADTNGSANIVRFVDNGTAAQSGTAIVTVDGTTKVFRGIALSPH